MNLDRALHYVTAALAVMGALFLGLAQESVILPLALALAAVVSVGLWRRFTWLRLNWLIANLMALTAVIWSMRHFLTNRMEDQLLAIADMLVYLQIVLLFQEKTARVYWQLIVLSLLQVVVAAALNLGPQFGLLLAVYMLTAMLALVLLCSYREWRRFTPTLPNLPAAAASLLGAPVAASPQSAAAIADGTRLAATVRRAALLGLATVAFAGVFFYATPRNPHGAWSDMRRGGGSQSGFRSQVTLAESGRIHLSSRLVMRVAVSSASTRQPYALVSEPYFHGMALAEYQHDSAGGRWVVGPAPRPNAAPLPLSPPHQSVPIGLVRQDYLLEGGANQLFAILPVYSVDGTRSEISVRSVSGRLVHQMSSDESRPMREFRYSVGTSSLRNGRQIRGIPHRNRNLTPGDEVALKNERELFTRFDRQRFAGLAELADRIIREAGAEQAGPLDQVLALERHFTEPEAYQYSLNLDFKRDPRLDPIEDFVLNHRTGHCEYFASALVMMLRSRNIPSRMLIGYRGGDFNTIGQYFQVRQRHAHAWVEALLPPESVPEWEIAGAPSGGGTWYRLDPTPSAVLPAAASEQEGITRRLMQSFDYAELLWRDYVLSLNALKQRETIYEPVSNRTLGAIPSWSGLAGLGRRLRWFSAANAPAQRVFDWRSGVLAMGLVLLVIGLANGIYLVLRGSGQLRRRKGATRRQRSLAPAFYRRLESLLARLPLRRLPGQTARELADLAARRLDRGQANAGLLDPRLAQLPREIVDAYYRVRFGGAALDSHEQAAIEHALAELTPAVGHAQVGLAQVGHAQVGLAQAGKAQR